MANNGKHRLIKSGFAALTAIIAIIALQVSSAVLANVLNIFGQNVHSITYLIKSNITIN